MIRLLKIAIAAGLLWSGYWYAAGYGLRSGIAGWFSAQEARGWQADYANLSTSGYPLRHINTLTSPALADPATGAAWQADWLGLESPAIWPGRQTVRFAPTPQRLSYFDQTVEVLAQDMVAELFLHPGLALELQRMALNAGPWQVAGDRGLVMGGHTLTLAMDQTDADAAYRFNIRAENFTPGPALRRLARATDTLPAGFETLALTMTVTFDRPWDRRALEERRPQPVAIDLDLAAAQWGSMRIEAAGKLVIDARGRPEGAIDLRAENWREMFEMARASGNLPQSAVNAAERALGLLAGLGRDPDALDVQLNLRDGQVALGPFPLGPAPRLILR
jgi:hypothetical protein